MRFLTLFTVTAILAISCNKKSSAPEEVLAMILTAPGSWYVSNLTVGTEDKTSEFAGYTFIFTNDGKVKATSASTNTQGTWRIWYSGGGINENLRMFTLSFPSSPTLDLISKDWTTHGSDNERASFNTGAFVIMKN